MTDASQVAAGAATDSIDSLSCTRDSVELAAWLRLTETPGVGPVAARQLLAAFGLPQDIFAQPYSALARVLPERQARALLAAPDAALAALIERTVAWANEPGNAVFTLADRGYPPRLLELTDPPTVLYAKGDVSLLRAAAVGVVGARSATAAGIDNARAFAQALSAASVTIVSGLALGIDAAAHEGALNGPGSTIAVVGTGLDIVYPARNRALASTAADWVVWTDDDVLVSAGWLAAFVETARRRPDAAAVGGWVERQGHIHSGSPDLVVLADVRESIRQELRAQAVQLAISQARSQLTIRMYNLDATSRVPGKRTDPNAQ